VAVSWVQSLVRDPAAREILFDLDAARRAVFEREGKGPAFDLIAKSHANLLRRWAEG
jgi:PKHD-type hydroxylase